MKNIKFETISLQNNSEINEAWVQQQIIADPSILGIGEVEVRDFERRQLKAGRLDLLLQDTDTYKRYEAEIQLGPTDESHIIRTIEYWDLERKRYPQYDHCAVIIAEEITGRFFNVISLFNGHIPLIAIQIKAIKIGDDIGLDFTKIMDEQSLGLIDEDESNNLIVDREYWVKRSTKSTLDLVDKLVELIHSFSKIHNLKYNKFYIGLSQNGIANNFVVFKPKKQFVKIEVKIKESSELISEVENMEIENEYFQKWGILRIRIKPDEVDRSSEILTKLFKKAYEESSE